MEENYTKIIVKNLRMDMSIGVHDHEKTKEQQVIVTVEVNVERNPDWEADSIDNVLNYESIVSAIKDIAKRGHIELIETFVEHIAASCLQDPAIKDARVRVEKPDIFPFMDSIAVEIFRSKG